MLSYPRPSHRRALGRLLLPLLAVVVATSACKVRADVVVDVAEDGSGTVEVVVDLDREAVAALPDLDTDGTPATADLSALLRVDDLEAAGWQVDAPEPGDDGGATVRARKPFGTPDEGTAVLAEVTGPDGPLRDLRVERSTGLGRTEVTFTGTGDLSAGLEAFGDAGLAEALEGEPLGEDQGAIEQRFGATMPEMFSLGVTARLPGAVSADTRSSGGAVTWEVPMGGPARGMEATGTVRDVAVLSLVALAIASAVALVVVLAVRFARRVVPRP